MESAERQKTIDDACAVTRRRHRETTDATVLTVLIIINLAILITIVMAVFWDDIK